MQRALLLLGLNLRLNTVGVGDFAAVLKLLGNIHEMVGFRRCALSGGVFTLTDDYSVIGLRDRYHQPTRRDLRIGFGQRFLCPRQPIVGKALQRERLMHVPLTHILVHAVGSDESPRWRSVALGVKECGVVVPIRQQAGAGLYRLLPGYAVLGERGPILWLVGMGTGQRVLKRQRERRPSAGI